VVGGVHQLLLPGAFGEKCAPVKVEHTFLHTIGLLDCGVG
jgi:hypothetical protein